jgi:folate-binding protein YgfZ
MDRLKLYKLRAKVTLDALPLAVLALWDGARASDHGLCYPDPRLPALGLRCILPADAAPEAAAALGALLTEADSYEAHRIALGVPRGGLDFIYNDAFPHEADMDQLNGVDFTKGCYIGQEVVSRVEHRGTARSRVVPVAFDDFAPEAGAPVMAGDKHVGTMGSATRGRGLALLRLDRAADALADGTPLVAGGVALLPSAPDWARFAFPAKAES